MQYLVWLICRYNSICSKNDYASSAQSISNGKTEANVGNDAERKLLDKKSIGSTEDCISKENDKQVSNKPHNGHSQTKLKRISNRRKSMPVLRYVYNYLNVVFITCKTENEDSKI